MSLVCAPGKLPTKINARRLDRVYAACYFRYISFSSYKPKGFPSGFLFSALVIQELIASANDDSEVDKWVAARRAYEREDRLIVPDSADWLLASRILYWLMQKRKKAGGKSPPLKIGASQRMALDDLIAVSARRYNATIVTVNWSDFEAIQYLQR